jgi:phosphate-selective porin OprO/OprP
LALALRYDYLDLVDDDIQGGRGHAWTAGVNWYWTAYSKLQTNMIWGSIEDAGEGRNPSPGLAGIDGDFTILGMRYMIDF